jgi:hypothetical protein
VRELSKKRLKPPKISWSGNIHRMNVVRLSRLIIPVLFVKYWSIMSTLKRNLDFHKNQNGEQCSSMSESFNTIHIPCNTLIIQYLIQQIAQSMINNLLSLMFLLHVSTFTKSSSGRYRQRHTRTAKSVKDVHA